MQVRDGERQGWYAAPKTPSRRGVVIIHEIAGLNDDMRRIAGIFAEHGYHALVPRLFRSFGCLLRSLRELNSGPGSGEVADEVESWRQWLGHLQGAEQVAVRARGGSIEAIVPRSSTGIGFDVSGVPLAENSLLVEAGLDLNLSPTATIGVSYSGQFASELTDNAVKGRFTWLF